MQNVGPSETQVLVGAGLLVGITSGLGAVVFRYLIQGFNYVFFDLLQSGLATFMGSSTVIVIPAIGGLIFGPMIYFFAREAKGHGVPEVMMAVALRGGRIRPVVAVVKSLASAVCIGSGGSVGREGPIVQIGSALGSTVGQLFRMSDDRVRTLVACGAAGGIAATFNAPIAGVFFALEIILSEFTTRAFGVVVIAAVTASVIGRFAFGSQPAFPVPPYELVSVTEFPLYALLGVLAAVVGVGFTRLLYWFEDRFDDIRMKEYLKPVLGGLLLGAIGLFYPQVFGVGYPAISDALTGNFAITLLLALLVLKTLAVSLTIGSGGSGGVFAPSLFLGAMFGTAFGVAANAFYPGLTAPPGAYGLVGMAAVFAGSARAPITAVIILFELTGDYLIILPLMVAVVISTLTSEALSRDTIYTLKLRRRGIDLRAGRDVDLMRTITTGQAMTSEVVTATHETSVAEAGAQLEESHARALVVVDERGELDGIVTVQDIERVLLDNRLGATVGEVANRPAITAYIDEPLSQAIRRMGARDLGQVPVVTRAKPREVVGLLRRGDIVRAYSAAMLGRLESQQQRRILPRELRGTRVMELTIQAKGPLVGRKLADLRLPSPTLVIAVERGQQVVIPHGGTVLEGGDRLMILVRDEAVADLQERLLAQQGKAPAGANGKS
ncbi:MAG: chloride channel protein [Dehalococcoidales bacterium]|nr:chloride channel protein [Dehalococcoidales bacterium]